MKKFGSHELSLPENLRLIKMCQSGLFDCRRRIRGKCAEIISASYTCTLSGY